MRHVLRAASLATAVTLFGGCASQLAQRASVDGNWPTYHRDVSGARHSPLTQITPENVSQLQVAWSYHMRTGTADREGDSAGAHQSDTAPRSSRFFVSQATPIVVNSVMYLPTPYGQVVALDAESGAEIWVYELPDRDQASLRGVAYWPGSDDARPSIVFGTRRGKLISLDAETGRPVAGFGEGGMVDMKTPEVLNGIAYDRASLGMSSPPLVFGNLVITGSRVQEAPTKGPAGDVRAWDVRTGALRWTFHTVPREGEAGNETWAGDSWRGRSGTNVWTFLVADEERGIVYLPVSAPTFDRWGGDREGANLYANSIVAVDAATGNYLWHFQTVHHDIWDLDLTSALLVDVRKNGKVIPGIGVMNKTGMVFLLNRVTGEPIYPVNEVPVPTETDAPGEKPWPTQPMPTTPPPLTRLSFEMSELNNLTPEVRQRCEALIEQWNIVESKMFQPFRTGSAVASFPGSFGGVDWGGAAFDPERGLLIVNTNALGSPQQLEKKPDGSYGLKGGYRYFWDEKQRIPCQNPPWGELIAVDVNIGTIAWRETLGVSDNLPEGKRDTGRPSLGGPITTASGITFIGGTDDGRFRAFDSKSGALLWETKLNASAYATPMTFQSKSGKQYVAIVNTGGVAGQSVTNDELTVFSLP